VAVLFLERQQLPEAVVPGFPLARLPIGGFPGLENESDLNEIILRGESENEHKKEGCNARSIDWNRHPRRIFQLTTLSSVRHDFLPSCFSV
jgi:hypothetical protein